MKWEVYEITPTKHILIATDLTQRKAEQLVKKNKMYLMVPKEVD